MIQQIVQKHLIKAMIMSINETIIDLATPFRFKLQSPPATTSSDENETHLLLKYSYHPTYPYSKIPN